MTRQLVQIFSKPNDFKLCGSCNRINYYENEECIECGDNTFQYDGAGIAESIDMEYEFYKLEGFTEVECDNIEVEV